MSPYANSWRQKFAKSLCIATAAWTMSGCVSSTKPSPAALVIASCPPIAPQTDPSFGATVQKLVELGTQYRKCRAAALNKVE